MLKKKKKMVKNSLKSREECRDYCRIVEVKIKATKTRKTIKE